LNSHLLAFPPVRVNKALGGKMSHNTSTATHI
jgi:hypothetical protein